MNRGTKRDHNRKGKICQKKKCKNTSGGEKLDGTDNTRKATILLKKKKDKAKKYYGNGCFQ